MPKPDLDALIKEQRKAKKKPRRARSKAARPAPAQAAAPPPVPEQALPESLPELPTRQSEVRRDIFARKFITAWIANEFDGVAAYMETRLSQESIKPASAAVKTWELFQLPVVREEMRRQLAPIIKQMGLNENWVLDQWRAMAEADIFDYVKVGQDGKVTEFNLNPENLTKAQRQNIQTLKWDKDGKLTHIGLVSRTEVVANVARANKMFRDLLKEEDVTDAVKAIVEQMQRASKMLPPPPGRLFDAATGKEIEA